MASSSKLVSEYLQSQIARGVFPGAQYVIGEDLKIIREDALGLAVVEPERIPASVDTIYDLASLTKPLVTTLLSVIFRERGLIDLSAPVGHYLDEFNDSPGGRITIIELLTHTSGLPNWKPLYLEVKDPSQTLAYIARTLDAPRDSKTDPDLIYSDLNYILLGCVLERLTGERLDRIAQKEIFSPLSLKRTMFKPPAGLKRETAATEHGQMFEQANALEECAVGSRQLAGENPPDNPVAFDAASYSQLPTANRQPQTDSPPPAWRKHVIWGEVHDGNAHFLGGVAGHAGLFSTAREVFGIANQFLPGSELVTGDSLRLFTENLTPRHETARSIGWIIAATKDCSAGAALPVTGIGHNGFTGTSIWMDTRKRRVFILLTNRIHPRVGPTDMKEVRQQFNCLATHSLDGEGDS
jgi:serine-type D-Ala-D-Ala carboxypeptidase